MERVITCDCGFEAVAETDDELIVRAQAHSQQAHGQAVPSELLGGLARPPQNKPGPSTGRR